MALTAIEYSRGSLRILNQLLLPFESVYEPIRSVHDGHVAIKTMKTRGAPALAITAVLTLAVDLHARRADLCSMGMQGLRDYISTQVAFLQTARPTAVNLFSSTNRLVKVAEAFDGTCDGLVSAVIGEAERQFAQDVQDNTHIGRFGAETVLKYAGDRSKICVLTHCNTGSLATAGWVSPRFAHIQTLTHAGHRSRHHPHALCSEQIGSGVLHRDATVQPGITVDGVRACA
jgi:methylthioribose-1-phosphate isomerase